jgi:hypothetical protein
MQLTEIILDDNVVHTMARQLCQGGFMPIEMSFANKSNRDNVARIAKQMGAGIRKSSIRNQLLDPRYVEEGRHLPDRGLMNEKRMFSAIYHVERTL